VNFDRFAFTLLSKYFFDETDLQYFLSNDNIIEHFPELLLPTFKNDADNLIGLIQI